MIAFNIDRWNIAKLKIKTGTVTSTRVPVVRNNFAIKLKIFHGEKVNQFFLRKTVGLCAADAKTTQS